MIDLIPPEKPVFRIITREEWAGKECPPLKDYIKHRPDGIVIHETTSPTAKQFQGIRTMQGIYRYHAVNPNTWGDIGYHFIISPSGHEIYECRPADVIGAHCGGDLPAGVKRNFGNTGKIGICLAGNYSTETPDPQALKTLCWLIADQCEKYDIKLDQIFGHCQAWSRAPKVCPGKNLFAALFGIEKWKKIKF